MLLIANDFLVSGEDFCSLSFISDWILSGFQQPYMMGMAKVIKSVKLPNKDPTKQRHVKAAMQLLVLISTRWIPEKLIISAIWEYWINEKFLKNNLLLLKGVLLLNFPSRLPCLKQYIFVCVCMFTRFFFNLFYILTIFCPPSSNPSLSLSTFFLSLTFHF